ncbi:MAG: TRAP transporter small permease [Alphaproteobacteria bacterium]|nr:TRAP transporter small permease [Alphaproteobacteria bacterium]
MTSLEQKSNQGGLGERLWHKLESILGFLAAVLIFILMALTFIDVVGRQFDYPLPGGLEITEIMMGAVIFLGLPLVTADNGHVAVDLLDNLVPQNWKALQQFFINVLGAVVLAVVSYKLWGRAHETLEYGDNTAYLQIPLAPLVFFMSVMAGMTCLIFIGLSILAFKKHNS